MEGVGAHLQAVEAALRRHYAGRRDWDRWWPARSRFEVIAGAILVQNTSWGNVERALGALRAAGRLSLAGVRGLSEAELGRLIRSSGCWRQKAKRLRGFVAWLDATHGGSLARLFAQPTAAARRQLLTVHGIGEETADAILLFAGRHPSFVMDAYTRRILQRHRLPTARAWVEAGLPREARAYAHLHAFLVETAKQFCRKSAPQCGACPLQPLLPAVLP
jgi:endonuclease-3 related protein